MNKHQLRLALEAYICRSFAQHRKAYRRLAVVFSFVAVLNLFAIVQSTTQMNAFTLSQLSSLYAKNQFDTAVTVNSRRVQRIRKVVMAEESSSSSSSVHERVMLRKLERAQRASSARSLQTSSKAASVVQRSSRASSIVNVPTTLRGAAPESSSEASVETAPSVQTVSNDFPAFGHTVFPISKVPNWGAMRSPAEWDRHYSDMTDADFVSIPRYDLSTLTIPLDSLIHPLHDEDIPTVTAKLFYSTRYFGAYHLDSSEFMAVHPGIDMKLAEETPVGSVAGGKVHAVRDTKNLGLHVIVEHRLGEETFYSIYGHLGTVAVAAGDAVKPGQTVGYIGLTGNTTAPHLHLQIDKGAAGEEAHIPYYPASVPSQSEAATHTVHPIQFIVDHR